jgi:hypothetical protein
MSIERAPVPAARARRTLILAAVAVMAAGACFDPTFHTPNCGVGGVCPDGWTCAEPGVRGAACVADDGMPDPDGGPADAGADARPDAGPPPTGCGTKVWSGPLLGNGNFDAGRTVWREAAALAAIIQEGVLTADSGRWVAVVGGDQGQTETLSQTVTMPAGTERVKLTGKKCVASREPGPREPSPDDPDTMRVQVVTGDDATTALADVGLLSNASASSNTCGWSNLSFEVATPALDGQVVLRIRSKNSDLNVTTFYLDTLDLRAFACPPPAATGGRSQ